jgi:hypothetical protein
MIFYHSLNILNDNRIMTSLDFLMFLVIRSGIMLKN